MVIGQPLQLARVTWVGTARCSPHRSLTTLTSNCRLKRAFCLTKPCMKRILWIRAPDTHSITLDKNESTHDETGSMEHRYCQQLKDLAQALMQGSSLCSQFQLVGSVGNKADWLSPRRRLALEQSRIAPAGVGRKME